MGGWWSILKVFIFGFGLYLVIEGITAIKMIGIFLIGYSLGKIAAAFNSYFSSMRQWEHLNDVIDWEKVSESASSKEKLT